MQPKQKTTKKNFYSLSQIQIMAHNKLEHYTLKKYCTITAIPTWLAVNGTYTVEIFLSSTHDKRFSWRFLLLLISTDFSHFNSKTCIPQTIPGIVEWGHYSDSENSYLQ